MYRLLLAFIRDIYTCTIHIYIPEEHTGTPHPLRHYKILSLYIFFYIPQLFVTTDSFLMFYVFVLCFCFMFLCFMFCFYVFVLIFMFYVFMFYVFVLCFMFLCFVFMFYVFVLIFMFYVFMFYVLCFMFLCFMFLFYVFMFYVLLTVHLSIILVINQINAQNLVYNKFIICLYTFRAPCAHHQEVKIVFNNTCIHSNQSSLNLCTGRPPTGVMIPDAV